MKTRYLITISHNTKLNSHHLTMLILNEAYIELGSESEPDIHFSSCVHDENPLQMNEIKVSDFVKFSKKTGLPVKEFYYLPEVTLFWDGNVESLPFSINISEEKLNRIPLINPRFFFEPCRNGVYGVTLTIDRDILSKNSAQLGVAIIFFSVLSIEGDVYENTTEYLKWRFSPYIDKEMLIKSAKRVSVLI